MLLIRSSLLLLALLLNAGLLDSKVSDRWEHLKTPDMRCRWLISAFMSDHSVNKIFVSNFEWWYKKLNCTLLHVYTSISVYSDADGSYSGWVGMIQRNEADFAFGLFRPDNLPFEPVKFTPPLASGEISIISRKTAKPSLIRRQITYFLHLDWCLYVYVFTTCFFMFPSIYTFFQLSGDERMQANKFLRKYCYNCFRVLTLLLDQEQFEPLNLANCILALSISIFSLAAVFGILLNTVGADLVVTKQPPAIDSLEDLLDDPQFAHSKPVVLAGFPEYSVLEYSRPGSKERRLFDRMMKDPEHSFVSPEAFAAESFYFSSKISDFLQLLFGDEIALVLVSFFAQFVPICTCFMRDSEELAGLKKFVHQQYIAKETFGGGTLNAIYSHQTHPYIEKAIVHIFRCVNEHGIFDAYMKSLLLYAPEMVKERAEIKYDTGYLKCIEKVAVDQDNFFPINVKQLLSVFEIWAFTSSGLSFVLIAEVVYVRYWLVKKRRWRRARRIACAPAAKPRPSRRVMSA